MDGAFFHPLGHPRCAGRVPGATGPWEALGGEQERSNRRRPVLGTQGGSQGPDVLLRPEGARGLKGNVSGGGGRGDGPGRGRRCRRPLGRRLSGGPGRPGRGGEVGRRLRRCGGFTGPARAVRLIWRTGNQKRDTIQSFSYII